MTLREIAKNAASALKRIFGRRQQAEDGQQEPQEAAGGQQEAPEGQQEPQERAQEGADGQQAENLPSAQENGAEWQIQAMENAKNAILDCAEKMQQALKPEAERIAASFAEFYFQMSLLNMTPAKRRKMELMRRYWKAKMEMSNNERRRRGLPMVRRPKRSQYAKLSRRRAEK